MVKKSNNEESSITNENVLEQDQTKETDPLAGDLPKKEVWAYLGNDSTPVVDVASITPEEAGEDDISQSVDEWFRDREMSTEEVKSTGIELLKEITKKFNVKLSTTGTVLTNYALLLGKICNKLKQKIAAPGKKWEFWAEENIPFLASRNRSKYMLLAERLDCHPYKFLGIDRLEYLCRVTKEWNEKNPIGFLMEKYGIAYDAEDDAEESLKEFKNLVDAACHSERLINRKISANHELVKTLTHQNCKFKESLIKTLKGIIRSEGDPDIYLKTMIANGGKEPSEKESSGKSRIEDFNSLSMNLMDAVDFITDKPEQIAKIDKKILLDLQDRINKLIESANLT